MKKSRAQYAWISLCGLVSLLGGFAQAGEIAISDPEPAIYEAGRGLITLEGPSGMFINPTSATLPQGAFTAQYCMFSPFLDDSIVAHGSMISYGFTDWLEAGALLLYVDNTEDPFAAGPFVRARVMKQSGLLPQIGVGYYGRYGSDFIEQNSVFGAAYYRIPIGDESGLVKSIGFHLGLRNTWWELADNEFRGYGGVELQLPYRLYLVGEMSSRDNDFDIEMPFSYGVQWRAGGVNISLSALQPGNLPDGPGLWFGIGSQLAF